MIISLGGRVNVLFASTTLSRDAFNRHIYSTGNGIASGPLKSRESVPSGIDNQYVVVESNYGKGV